MRRALLLLPLTLIALSGCGADDEPTATTETAATQTETAPATVTERTQTTPPTATTPPATVTESPDDGGGVPAPGADTEPRQAPEPEPDSPTNDLPPPADSPAERFEKDCEQQPGSCG